MVDNVHLLDIGGETLVLRSTSTETLHDEHGLVDLTSVVNTAARQSRMKQTGICNTTAIVFFEALLKHRERRVGIIICLRLARPYSIC